jgi:hypothetical protein
MRYNTSKGVPLWLTPVFCIACVVVGVWHFAIRPPTGRQKKSPIIAVVNNLKQIEISRRVWASEHNITGAVEPSMIELAPYLPRGSTNLADIAIMGERYTINAFGVSPEAQLTRPIGEWPRGTTVRLQPGGMPSYQLTPPDR